MQTAPPPPLSPVSDYITPVKPKARHNRSNEGFCTLKIHTPHPRFGISDVDAQDT